MNDRRPAVKICCIESREEAALAASCGATAIGLVSAMPSGPGVIDEATIRRIVAAAPRGVATFLLTSRTDPEEIEAQQRRTRADTLQLVDRLAPDALRSLRRRLPGVSLVQVVHVRGEHSVEEAVAVAPLVDAVLLDSGNPDLPVRQLGGTGRVHDWSHSRAIVERAGCPVYLAGGLRPGNLAAALGAVRPFGVDVCSGVRTDGRLDEERLRRFMRAARGSGKN
ncbi:MAG: phosphoribosylanthranilate isomerase [Gemmatimonadales bacterium]|nr:phosphoribosylanthranilate isomerase [Candidatus Palauibacter irciniicola]MYC19635.1 phosphoribosylanthranilate isomerase [Gemmatimonadales bacterium]